MMLADIVVDQLVFLLAAPEDVLEPDSAVTVLQDTLSRLSEVSAEELAPVRRVAAQRLADGQPEAIEAALRELVLLLRRDPGG